MTKKIDGVVVLKDISFTLKKGDKVVLLSRNEIAKTALLDLLAGETEPDSGTVKWGITAQRSYFPADNSKYFEKNPEITTLVDWLRQYSAEKDESYNRGFLGKMLFSGEEVLKMSNVLSGGEKVRCMISRMMLTEANVLILDEPTNHLDLETITTLNNALINFPGNVLFTSRDHTFTQTIANRVIELGPKGFLDKLKTFDEYIDDKDVEAQASAIY